MRQNLTRILTGIQVSEFLAKLLVWKLGVIKMARYVLVCDEFNRERIPNYVDNIRKRLRNHSNPFEMPENRFVELFRFPQAAMIDVIEELRPHMIPGIRTRKVPIHLRLLAAVHFFASGSYQRTTGLGIVINLSQSQMSRVINEVCNAICNNIIYNWIKFPAIEEYGPIKERFMEKYNFPGVIGAIDGTHVAIKRPGTDVQHTYFNRKMYHSKNVLIVCDADYKILYINARQAGSTHDAFVWRASGLRQELLERFRGGTRNSWLIGDQGFPLEAFLMTPYRNQNDAENAFNACHIGSRACVERCIGVLKCRFRCLLKERVLCYSPEKAGKIISACAVLHNMLMQRRIPLPQEDFVDKEMENDAIEEDIFPREPQEIRNRITRNYLDRNITFFLRYQIKS